MPPFRGDDETATTVSTTAGGGSVDVGGGDVGMRRGIVFRRSKSLSSSSPSQQQPNNNKSKLGKLMRSRRNRRRVANIAQHQQQQQQQPLPASMEQLNELFHPRFRHYSPTQGRFFTCNGFIADVYRYNDRTLLEKRRTAAACGWGFNEPAVDLVHQLFQQEESSSSGYNAIALIPPQTHQHKHSVANMLSANAVGEIFEVFEAVRFLNLADPQGVQSKLSSSLFNLIGNSDAFRRNQKRMEDQLCKAQLALLTLEQIDEKDNKTLLGPDAPRVLVRQRMDLLQAKQHLREAQAALRTERENQQKLADIIASSFLTYELQLYGTATQSSSLPKFSTSAILLAYLWHKYSQQPQAFVGYLKVMSHTGALNCPLEQATKLLEGHNKNTKPEREDDDGDSSPSSAASI